MAIMETSVIRTSGQWWKAQVLFWPYVAGALAMFSGLSFITDKPETTPGFAYLLLLGGVALLVTIFITTSIAVYCGACGARWFWRGANGKLGRNWIQKLMSEPNCPACGAKNGRKAT
jgi:hypothetical protein